MSLRSKLGLVRQRIVCSQHRRPVAMNDTGPFVSFSFDDFPRTALTTGGAILSNRGVRGTYYVAMGLMGISNEQGEHFRREDLHQVLQDGHELGSHTFSHPSSRRVPLSAFQEDVRKGHQALREFASSRVSENFAYPFGEATVAAKKAVGTEMMSCRGVYPGVNGPDVDLNLLNANLLYGDIENLGEVEQLVRENERQKGWLIFYTHDVCRKPSLYGCTPELLEAACRIACEHAQALPVGEVIRAFRGRATPATA
jgi:peptidoglycan/xylan/chitin deacetylase (PgdA/CDA1 family)